MDLRYTAADDAFRTEVREWLTANAPRQPLQTTAERKAWHRTLYEAGYLGMGWPISWGGREARPVEQAIVIEEMARAGAPASINWAGLGLVGPTLIHHGTDAQRERYIRSILLGDEVWCQLYSEPNAGSDLASLQCRADLDDDEFIVNGQKIWTSTATEADMGIMLVRTDRAAPKHQGISCIMVDMRLPGVEVRPLRQITGIADEFAEVFFSNVRVPAENLIGSLNAGWRIAQTTLSYERGGDLVGAVSRLDHAYERLIAILVRTCRIDDSLVRAKLGQIKVDIEVLRYASLRILSSAEKGHPPGPESAISKLHYSETDKRVFTLMNEILGPSGQMLNTGADPHDSWAYLLLQPFAETIYAGSSEIQKNIIGERVLGLPKEVRADRIAR